MSRLLILGVLALAGCGLVSRFKPAAPAFAVTPTPAGPTVTQTGPAAVPAKVNTETTQTTIPFPPGAKITIETSPAQTMTPAAVITETRQQITAPTAFAPPAPPTAREQANADAVTRSYYFAGVLAILAGLLAWRAHLKAAGIAALGAIAVPLVTNFISSEWGQRVLIAVVCIAGALYAAWHFMNDKKAAATPPTS